MIHNTTFHIIHINDETHNTNDANQKHPDLMYLVSEAPDAEFQARLRMEYTVDMQDRGPLELSREVMRARGRFPL